MRRALLTALLLLAGLCGASAQNGQPVIGPVTGAWVPADQSGGNLTFTGVVAKYVIANGIVYAFAGFSYPAQADANNAAIGPLPATVPNTDYARQCSLSFTSAGTRIEVLPLNNSTNIQLWVSGTGFVRATNANMSGAFVTLACIYPAT